jgi:hypothetical protein
MANPEISPIPLIPSDRINDTEERDRVFRLWKEIRDSDPESSLLLITDDPNFGNPVLCLDVQYMEDGEVVRNPIALLVKGVMSKEDEIEFIRFLMNDVQLFTSEELAKVWNQDNLDLQPNSLRNRDEQYPQAVGETNEVTDSEGSDDNVEKPDDTEDVTDGENETRSDLEIVEDLIDNGVLILQNVNSPEDAENYLNWLGQQRNNINANQQFNIIIRDTEAFGPVLAVSIKAPRMDVDENILKLGTFNVDEVVQAVVSDRHKEENQRYIPGDENLPSGHELIEQSFNRLNSAVSLLLRKGVITSDQEFKINDRYGKNCEYAYYAIAGVGFGEIPDWASVMPVRDNNRTTSDIYKQVIDLRETISYLNPKNIYGEWFFDNGSVSFKTQVELPDQTLNLITVEFNENTDIRYERAKINSALMYLHNSGIMNDQQFNKATDNLKKLTAGLIKILDVQDRTREKLPAVYPTYSEKLEAPSEFFKDAFHNYEIRVSINPEDINQQEEFFSVDLPPVMNSSFEQRRLLVEAFENYLGSEKAAENAKELFANGFEMLSTMPKLMKNNNGNISLVYHLPYKQFRLLRGLSKPNQLNFENRMFGVMKKSLDAIFLQHALIPMRKRK